MSNLLGKLASRLKQWTQPPQASVSESEVAVEPYIYRPEVGGYSFKEGLTALRATGKQVEPIAIDISSPEKAQHIIELGQQAGIEFVDYAIDLAGYRQYYQQADYQGRYSEYYVGNQVEKSLEHYIALTLLDLGPTDVFIDLASEHSPIPEIYGRLTGATTYSQDIMYPPGINGNQIGGDACAMPVPDGFASKATLTCSLEHFERDADTRLFVELARVLKPGGKVCIIPFYVYDRAAVQTDPSVSVPARVVFDPEATIYCAEGWGNRHGRFYSPKTFVQRILQPVQHQFKFEFYYLKNAVSVDASVYARFAFTATRL